MTTAEALDGQARRRLATRERLYEAAVALVAERGYEAATIDEIAARAGTSRRTSFNHFPSKSEITLEWTRRRRAQATAAAKAAGSQGDVLDRFRAYFRGLAAITEERPTETREMLLGYLRACGPVLHPSPMSLELAGLADDQGAGGDSRLGVVGEVLFDVYSGVLWRWMRDPAPRRGAFTAALDAAVEVALAGVAASLGAEPG
ncbi:TetR/AcrR family transcriptional regulator [Amycolatopsis pigmentata]|uniref:TetR/AcrR family transcriptional regulator n=1 Tax=Amycolatopsis pigmentata TaxID=450801 RepID=A0ABW5FP69_9PSEU